MDYNAPTKSARAKLVCEFRYFQLLEKSKLMLSEHINKYPDDHNVIERLNNSIIDIETKYRNATKSIQQRYEEYCNRFSLAYLSGSDWYNYIL